MVHNGIVENAEELLKELSDEGIGRYGQTDSEIVAKLVGREVDRLRSSKKPPENSFLKGIENTLPRLDGAYAFLFMHKDSP